MKKTKKLKFKKEPDEEISEDDNTNLVKKMKKNKKKRFSHNRYEKRF